MSPGVRNGAGVLRVTGYAAASGAAATATIELALVKDGKRIGYYTGTATTESQQEGSNYMVTFAWAETSNSKIDLLGCGSYSPEELGGTTNTGGKRAWFIGVPAMSGVTSITLELSEGPI
jgi:hypothetical protein